MTGEGEFSGSNLWAVIDTSTGNVITTIAAGTGPHDTIVSLNGQHYDTLVAAKAAGAATLNYGLFINAVIDFLIVAVVLFLVVKSFNKLRREEAPVVEATKECPFCLTKVALKATRCPACTSELEAAAQAA